MKNQNLDSWEEWRDTDLDLVDRFLITSKPLVTRK